MIGRHTQRLLVLATLSTSGSAVSCTPAKRHQQRAQATPTEPTTTYKCSQHDSPRREEPTGDSEGIVLKIECAESAMGVRVTLSNDSRSKAFRVPRSLQEGADFEFMLIYADGVHAVRNCVLDHKRPLPGRRLLPAETISSLVAFVPRCYVPAARAHEPFDVVGVFGGRTAYGGVATEGTHDVVSTPLHFTPYTAADGHQAAVE